MKLLNLSYSHTKYAVVYLPLWYSYPKCIIYKRLDTLEQAEAECKAANLADIHSTVVKTVEPDKYGVVCIDVREHVRLIEP